MSGLPAISLGFGKFQDPPDAGDGYCGSAILLYDERSTKARCRHQKYLDWLEREKMREWYQKQFPE